MSELSIHSFAGSENPFFCIQGHFGNVLYLNDLAKSLKSDRPFYSVKSVGQSGKRDPLAGIEEMIDPQPNAIKNILIPEAISAFYSTANEQRVSVLSNALNKLSVLEKVSYLGGNKTIVSQKY